MRVLVTWSSKRGSTEGIGRAVGEALQGHGFEVVAAPVDRVVSLDSVDAVILGGALYANRWPRKARNFVNHHVRQLRAVPVWFFSSGPLDGSADQEAIPAPTQVAALAERVGAKGHITFGGRLEHDATGFPASALAKTKSGDWRNFARIRAWAAELATELPTATPGKPIERSAHSLSRLLTHAVVGWALCAVTMATFLSLVSLTSALVIHAITAPLFFTAIAWHYFRARGAREPASTAIVWTAIIALLDLIIVAGAGHNLEMFKSLPRTWLPLGLILIASWTTGEIMSMLPAGRAPRVAR